MALIVRFAMIAVVVVVSIDSLFGENLRCVEFIRCSKLDFFERM